MDKLDDAVDKLFTEVDHLDKLFEAETLPVDLALSVTKRVRRHSTLVVQQLAALRDATTQEGTST